MSRNHHYTIKHHTEECQCEECGYPLYVGDRMKRITQQQTDQGASVYRIIRFYQDGPNDYDRETDLTLEEAREHCRDPSTTSSKDGERHPEFGEWFDGYTEE